MNNNLKNSLAQFSGTENYHRWSALFKYVLTDGAKFLADEAKAYWFMDLIASHQGYAKVRNEPFQVWALTVGNDKTAMAICDDGNENELSRQFVPYTDFPLSEVKVYFIDGVILLPSEY